ncbi:hypothetical protein, partial [Pseudomonas sp. Sample_22]|uniref:hypothetical protein n=1 Tax=Pseudomonas sp. Sample_22 TaxID=2448266 RepID=UPI0015AD8A52
ASAQTPKHIPALSEDAQQPEGSLPGSVPAPKNLHKMLGDAYMEEGDSVRNVPSTTIKRFSETPVDNQTRLTNGVVDRIVEFKTDPNAQTKKVLYIYGTKVGSGGITQEDVSRSENRIKMMAAKGHEMYYAGSESKEDIINSWNDIGTKIPEMNEVIFDFHGNLSPSQKFTPAIQLFPGNQFNLSSIDQLEKKNVPSVKFYNCYGGFMHCNNFATKTLEKMPGVNEVFASDGVRIDNGSTFRWDRYYPNYVISNEAREMYGVPSMKAQGKLRYSRNSAGDIQIENTHTNTPIRVIPKEGAANPLNSDSRSQPIDARELSAAGLLTKAASEKLAVGEKYDTRLIVKLESDPV